MQSADRNYSVYDMKVLGYIQHIKQLKYYKNKYLHYNYQTT